ncbi:uncharacterized protein LOC108044974 [Drosophila rhopaloa]|nr:uncharacterized protein LOC108044974 [Drosophila rhopaloa]
MWLGSHKRAPRKSKTVSLEIEHFRHPSDSSNKSYSTVSSINNSKSHSSSYEKFKPPQLNSIIKTKERSDDNIVKTNRVIKPKHFQITKSDDNLVKTNRVITPKHFQITKSDEAVNQSNKIIETKHFKIRSNFNPVKTEFWTSQKGILPTVKSKLTNSMLGRQSIKSFESVGKEYNQPSMSQVAAAVINRLYDGKTISLDETSFQKKVDTSKIHINSFLGKISKLRPADQMNAVWNDLQETYKEMSRSAKTPEDVQKFKKILKWRYIHNVQKLLHHQIKQFKIDLNSGRSELGTRRSQILNRTVRSSNFIPNSNDTSGLFKKVSRMDTPSNKTVHENFVRMQMEMLRSRIFDRDVYGMERMIMGRELPITPKDFEIFEKYKSDPNHYNILILSINKSLSDEKYEEKLPMLERNFQFICNQLEEISRQRRKDNMLTKHDLQKAEDDVVSKISGESFLERIDFNEAFLAKRREVWADYIAKQAKTPTEILLAAARKQKRKAQLAKKAEEREKRNKQDQQVPKRKRSLTALYRAPRKTHRERQAIKEIKEEMEEIEVRKSKRSVTCSCCRRCSRSGVVWTQKCSEDNTEESHICPVLNYDSCS